MLIPRSIICLSFLLAACDGEKTTQSVSTPTPPPTVKASPTQTVPPILTKEPTPADPRIALERERLKVEKKKLRLQEEAAARAANERIDAQNRREVQASRRNKANRYIDGANVRKRP